MPAILVCLPAEEDSEAVLKLAARLSRDWDAQLSVVHVRPPDRDESPELGPGAWLLRTDAPVGPLRRFASRNRITHILLGKEGWRRWGRALGGPAEVLSG
jgi:K+-sensing histidine kinase KdpD